MMSTAAEDGKDHVLHITVLDNSEEATAAASTSPEDTGDAKLLKPFSYGFKRELVFRGPSEGSACHREADAYYRKDGIKMRSKPQVLSYLSKHPEIPLTGENFSFCKRSIHEPPHEVVRRAKPVAKPVLAANKVSLETPKVPVIRLNPESEQLSAVRRRSSDDAGSDGSEQSAAKRCKTSELTNRGMHVDLSVLVPEVTMTANDASGEGSEADAEGKQGEEEERRRNGQITPSSGASPSGEPKKCEALYDLLRSSTNGPSSRPSSTCHLVKTYSKTQPTVLEGEKKRRVISLAPSLRTRNKITPANPVQSRTGAALELCNLQCPSAKGRIPTLQCAQCLCLFHAVCVKAQSATSGEEPFMCRACHTAPSSPRKPDEKKVATPSSLLPSVQKPKRPNITVIASRPDKDDSRRSPFFRIRSSGSDTCTSTAGSKADDAARVPNSTSPASVTSATTAATAATRRDGAPLPVIKLRAPTTDSAVAMLLSLVHGLNKSKVQIVDKKCEQKTICTNYNAGSGSVVSTSASPLPKPVFRVDLFKSLSKDGTKDIPKDSTVKNRVITSSTYFPKKINGAAKGCHENGDSKRSANENSSDEDGLAIDVSSADSSRSLSPKSFPLTDATLSELLADCTSSSMPNAVWSHDDTETQSSAEVKPDAEGCMVLRSSRDLRDTAQSRSADSRPSTVNISSIRSGAGREQDFRATRALRGLFKQRDMDIRNGKSPVEGRSSDADVCNLEADTRLEGKCDRGKNSTGRTKGFGSSGIGSQLLGSKQEENNNSKEKCHTKSSFTASMACFTTGYRVLDLIFRRLSVPTLCRAAQVCSAWNCLSKQTHLWEHVDLTEVSVKDWERCVAALDCMRSHTLTADGRMWHHLAEHMQRLHGIRNLRLKDVSPADLLLWANLFSRIASLRAVVAYNTTAAHMPVSIQRPAELRLEGFGCLGSLQELVLEGPAGLRLLPSVPLVTNPLGNLRRLSLKKVVEKCPAESFLSSMKELEELEYGSCRSWTILCFKAVSTLGRLTSLTLIEGGCQEGLSEALVKLKCLERLRLKRWKFTESLDPALQQLRNLKELELPLDASQGDARSNLNALLSCINLGALKCLSWTVTCHHSKGLPMTWWREAQPPPPFLDTIRIPIQGKTCSCARSRRTSCCDASRKVGRIVNVSSNPKEGITPTELSEGLRRILSRVDVVVYVDFPT